MVVIYENTESTKEVDMENPGLSEKKPEPESQKEGSELFNPYLEKFLEIFEENTKKKIAPTDAPIKVSEVFGRLAWLYEKIRNTVEYKGEHVLRRNAIERILKRLVWAKEGLKSHAPAQIAESLLRELIWARYLPNNLVPKRKIKEVAGVIEKYLFILSEIGHIKTTSKRLTTSKIRNWLWGVSAAEIEEVIDPSNREMYVSLMDEWFLDFFDWQEPTVDAHEKKIQIYLSIHRALPKSDDATLRYHLLQKEFEGFRNAKREEVVKFLERFPETLEEIEEHLAFSGKLALFRRIQRYAAAFDILKEVAEENADALRKVFLDKIHLELKIREVCRKKYKDIKNRIVRGTIRSIIYIFITKVVFAFLLEIPYEIYRQGDVRYLPLMINITFPALMMFLIGITIKTPDEKNTKVIIDRINSVAYRDEDKSRQLFSIGALSGSSQLFRIFAGIYSVISLLVFAAITYLLFQIGYSIFGVLVFFIFLSMVLLFGFRIKFSAQQLKAEGENETILTHLFSYLTLPFLNVGFYLSDVFSKLNFFAIIFDFLIEAPLKSIIEVVEQWTSFLREKRDEVVELPE